VEIFPFQNVILQPDKSKGKLHISRSCELDLDFDEDTEVYFLLMVLLVCILLADDDEYQTEED
ncbi:hypothetical protein MKW92_042746, partial [Papaver armeniacum]